jgi:putative endonuclease
VPHEQPLYPPHVLGRRGEALARDHLVSLGWTILERNYRFGRREVDLIVRRGNLIAFVEVKTRAGEGYGAPEDAVTWHKRKEIEAVAHEYLTRHRPGDVDVRFDVISVTVGRGVRIEHIEDAWRPESA